MQAMHASCSIVEEEFFRTNIRDHYPATLWRQKYTVAHAQYLRMIASKTNHEFQLQLVREGERLKTSPVYNIDQVHECTKRMVALRIQSGEIQAIDTEEAKLVTQHLEWCGSPDFSPFKRNYSTDGIINRYKLVMVEYDDPWDVPYTRSVRLEVELNEKVVFRNSMHLKWTTTVESVAEQCAVKTSIDLKGHSMSLKANGVSMIPNLSTTIGEIDYLADCLHLRVCFNPIPIAGLAKA